MPSRPCLKCGALSPESYCELHRPEKENARSKARLEKEPHRRIYATGAWRSARKKAFIRDGHRCVAIENGERCKVTNDLTGHHIVPLRVGGDPFDVANVTTLCRPHHAEIERLLQTDLLDVLSMENATVKLR